ncbi:MAG TPA: hypothetical protein VFY57_08165, partial [Rubrobacteraceae bacterium]|nr:hypothetical protein [Rubrobacteraceae bacterium]
MSAANSFNPALLATGLAAARRALGRLDEEEIPARVRAVAKRSGRLPAPLAASLVAELNRNEWLREIALEELGDDVGSDIASIEFLRREPGWEERLAVLAEKAQSALAEKSRRLLEEDLAAAKEEIETLRRQLRRTTRQAGQASTRKAETPNRELELKKLRATLSSTQKDLATSEAARERLMTEVEQLQDRLESLLRRRTGKSTPRTAATGGMRRGPLALA